MPLSMDWNSQPFQQKPWHVRLEDTIPDALYHSRTGARGVKHEMPRPGALRFESNVRGADPFRVVQCDGPCWFRWGVNRQGGAVTRGYLMRKKAPQSVTCDSPADENNGNVNQFTDTSQFTAHEEVGGLLHILNNNEAAANDAGGAGGAPEGEWARVVANTVSILYLQPALSLAPASGDTGIIVYDGVGTLGAAGIERDECLGIVIAASLADDYWGWFLVKGKCTVRITTAAGTARGLIAAANGELVNSAAQGQDLILGKLEITANADLSSQLVMANMDMLMGLPFTP